MIETGIIFDNNIYLFTRISHNIKETSMNRDHTGYYTP